MRSMIGVAPSLLLAIACASEPPPPPGAPASPAQTPPPATSPAEPPAPEPQVHAPPPAPAPPVAPAPVPPPVPVAPPSRDPGAEADFRDAVARFERMDPEAERALLSFVANHPAHPSRAAAERYLDYLAGLRDLAAGRAADAWARLWPWRSRATSPDRLAELRGALAESGTTIKRPEAAALWEEYARVGREPEQAYARLRIAEIRPPATSSAGERAPAGPGDPRRIGLALPLSGKQRVLGEAILRGAMLAAGVPAVEQVTGATAPPSPFELAVRDTGRDPERAAAAVAELIEKEAVIGVVGPLDGKALAAAAQAGVPVLSLTGEPPVTDGTAFEILHSSESRVVELARRALALGARSFAVLAPDSAAGKRQVEAFRAAVIGGGGQIAAEQAYVARATSFGKPVAALKAASFDALFIPDSSGVLELVAPALAVADLWPRPWGTPRPKAEKGKPRPRNVLLLSTASGLGTRLVERAGRYVQGALLCPGFFADASARDAPVFGSFRSAHGQDPGVTEAYSHDAVGILREGFDGGAPTRAQLAQKIAVGTFPGLTGDVRFGADHGRADPPLVYTVDGGAIHRVP